MQQNKRVGFIGFGSIAQKHISTIKRLAPEYEIVVLSSRAADLSEKYQSIHFVTNISDFSLSAPQTVCIASPSADHAKFITQISQFASQLLIEKPIAASKKQASLIMRAIENSKCEAFVGYNLRFMDSFKKVREILAKGTLGKIIQVQGSVGQDLAEWRPSRVLESTSSASKERGGGVLRELSHEIDILYELFGAPDNLQMLSATTKYTDLNVEDCAHVTFLFKSPNPMLASICMDFTRKNHERWMIFYGTSATLKWNLKEGSCSVNFGSGWQVLLQCDNDIIKSYETMWKSFLNKRYNKFSSIPAGVAVVSIIEQLEHKTKKGSLWKSVQH